MVAGVPMSAGSVALVHQHVPESVLEQLGDWGNEIPLLEPVKLPVKLKDISDVSSELPDILKNKLFFTQGFYNSRAGVDSVALGLSSTNGQELIITHGIALAFFEYSKVTDQGGREWHTRILHTYGFKDGTLFGNYHFGRRKKHLEKSYHDQYAQEPQRFPERLWDPQKSFQQLIDDRITSLIKLAQEAGARVFPRIPPEPVQQLLLNRVMPEVQQPLAEPAVQPAPAEVRLPPVPAVETPRAWYQCIVDLFSGCLAGLMDCIGRLVQALQAMATGRG
jgi:hypothetical protein